MSEDQLFKIVVAATGATGLTGFLIYVVKVLWVAHVKSDADMASRLDKAEARLVETVAALREIREGLELNADASDRLAKVISTLVRKGKP